MSKNLYIETMSMIMHHEGLRLKPYHCSAGALTIGFGRNLQANGISYDEAKLMLEHDLNAAIAQASSLDYWKLLNDPRKSCIVDLTYNIGFAGVKKFRKMREAILAGDWNEASKQMLDSKWARQVGKRAIRLAGIMRQGDW